VAKYEFVQREISDFDGVSPSESMCPNCKLSVDATYLNESVRCKACSNYAQIVTFTQKISSLTKASIIVAIFIFLTPFFITGLSMNQFLIPVLVIGLGPVILLSMYQMQLHMRGITKEHRINPLLAGYVITGNHVYYDEALKIWNENYSDLPETLRKSILHNLLVYVIISSVDSPDTVIEDWSKEIGISGQELFEKYLENDKDLLIQSIAPSIQFGYLSTIWPYVDNLDEKDKSEFISKIEEVASKILEGTLNEDYDSYAQDVFIDEIYVISDHLTPYLDDNPAIKHILDEYQTPELPTTSLGMLKSLTMATNEIMVNRQQAERRARQQ